MTYLSITVSFPHDGIDIDSAGYLLIDAGAESTEMLDAPQTLRVFVDPNIQEPVLSLVNQLGGIVTKREETTDTNWVALCPALQRPLSVAGLSIRPHASSEGIVPEPNVIHIIPGMGFGTGHHDTTFALMDMLGVLAGEGRSIRSVADIGTGSGILALAAATLFPDARVVGTDVDAAALANAIENTTLNDLTSRISLEHTSIPHTSSPFDVVIANLYAELLISLKYDLLSLVNRGGILLLSGIAVERDNEVEAAFAELPLSLQHRWESPLLPPPHEPASRWVARRYSRQTHDESTSI